MSQNQNRPKAVGQFMFQRCPTARDGAGAFRRHNELGEIPYIADEAQHEVLPSPCPAPLGEVQFVVEVVHFNGTRLEILNVHTARSTKTASAYTTKPVGEFAGGPGLLFVCSFGSNET